MELTINVPEGIEEVKFIFPTHKNTVKKGLIRVTASRPLPYGGFVVKSMELQAEFILLHSNKEVLQEAFNTLFESVLSFRKEGTDE